MISQTWPTSSKHHFNVGNYPDFIGTPSEGRLGIAGPYTNGIAGPRAAVHHAMSEFRVPNMAPINLNKLIHCASVVAAPQTASANVSEIRSRESHISRNVSARLSQDTAGETCTCQMSPLGRKFSRLCRSWCLAKLLSAMQD